MLYNISVNENTSLTFKNNAPTHTTLTKNRKLQECGYFKMWVTFACKTMAV